MYRTVLLYILPNSSIKKDPNTLYAVPLIALAKTNLSPHHHINNRYPHHHRTTSSIHPSKQNNHVLRRRSIRSGRDGPEFRPEHGIPRVQGLRRESIAVEGRARRGPRQGGGRSAPRRLRRRRGLRATIVQTSQGVHTRAGREGRRRYHIPVDATHGGRRRDSRRGERVVPQHAETVEGIGIEGGAFRGDGHIGGGGGGAQRPESHARRIESRVRHHRTRPVEVRGGGRRRAVLGIRGTSGERQLRQDGPQRHRVRRYAADRGGVRRDAHRARIEQRRDGGYFRRVERNRARELPDRDHVQDTRQGGRPDRRGARRRLRPRQDG